MPEVNFGHFYVLAEAEGFEPSHAGIKIQCLNQLGDSPVVCHFDEMEL